MIDVPVDLHKKAAEAAKDLRVTTPNTVDLVAQVDPVAPVDQVDQVDHDHMAPKADHRQDHMADLWVADLCEAAPWADPDRACRTHHQRASSKYLT
jgi:hypothetical protein